MTRPTKLMYTGDGKTYFPGVPARDLDEADLARLSDERVKEIAASALYVEPKAERAMMSDAQPVADKPAKPEPVAAKREP